MCVRSRVTVKPHRGFHLCVTTKGAESSRFSKSPNSPSGPNPLQDKKEPDPALISPRITFPWIRNNATTEMFPMEVPLGMSTFQSLLSISNPTGKPELGKRRKDLLLPHSTASSSPPTSAHASAIISPSSPAPVIRAAHIPVLS